MKIIVWILLKKTCVTSFQQLISRILSRELVTFSAFSFSVGIVIVIQNHGYAVFFQIATLKISREFSVSFQQLNEVKQFAKCLKND